MHDRAVLDVLLRITSTIAIEGLVPLEIRTACYEHIRICCMEKHVLLLERFNGGIEILAALGLRV